MQYILYTHTYIYIYIHTQTNVSTCRYVMCTHTQTLLHGAVGLGSATSSPELLGAGSSPVLEVVR